MPGLHSQRVLLARVRGVEICGVYFPLNKVKVEFWRDDFLPMVQHFHSRPSVLIGDFNTGKHLVDEVGRTFFGADHFESLELSGWTDAWRSLHPTGREYSWYSTAGNGFRVDHCLLSPSLNPRLVAAEYQHAPRLRGATDHSALVVQLAD